MPTVTMKQLLESGVHFGHQTRRWNPKMKRYIFGERGGIYIIDLQQTIVLLEQACDVVRDISERGGTVLFVGTKKQCQDADPASRPRRCGHAVRVAPLARRPADQLGDDLPAHPAPARAAQPEDARASSSCCPPASAWPARASSTKLETNLGGVADMQRLPDAVVIVDLKKEAIGVREANRLGLAGDRPGGHQLRPGRGDLRHPGQRRRHPLVRPGARRPRRRRARGQGHAARLRRAGARRGRAEEPAAEEPAPRPPAEAPAERRRPPPRPRRRPRRRPRPRRSSGPRRGGARRRDPGRAGRRGARGRRPLRRPPTAWRRQREHHHPRQRWSRSCARRPAPG